jgi:hypothetical protein
LASPARLSEQEFSMKRPYDWDEDDLLSLVQNAVKESLELDYKRCDSLQKTDGKKNELSKDVSAFTNSAGGTIVYGMVEDGHVPTKLDAGFDQAEITKEWIEQVINSNIQPRIDTILINQLELHKTHPGRVVYVVEIPQSVRGPHQAADHRYYKRFNFESVPMEDYEIRDVMRRASAPDLRCRFLFLLEGDLVTLIPGKWEPRTVFSLAVIIKNSAPTPASYAVTNLFIDPRLEPHPTTNEILQGPDFVEFLGGHALVLQAHWAISGDMPLLQDLDNKLLHDDYIQIRPPNKPIVWGEKYTLGWEVHSPGMTTTRGSANVILDSTIGAQIEET